MRALLLLLLGMAGCASSGDTPQTRLSRELAGRIAGEPQACVPVHQNHALQAVDDRTIVYRTPQAVWVNRLAATCSGLRPISTLIVDTFSGRFCRGDLVRGLEAGSAIPGPTCALGDFVPWRRPG